MDYVLALDQGTTSSRAILFNQIGEPVAVEQQPLASTHPHSGWVEQNPAEIAQSQLDVARKLIARVDGKIVALGITNQRETTIIWDRKTGQPVYPAIVWQDRRTADRCQSLRDAGLAQTVQQKTGLVIDPYFPATKIEWVLTNVAGVAKRAAAGELCFGTVDSLLIWHLSGGKLHVTDVSNASRSMLYNINSLAWDDELLNTFKIPREILPQVVASSAVQGEVALEGRWKGVPISGIAGDQQAALFGQLCLRTGMAKNTYGTGCFVMLQTGDKPLLSSHGLLTTIGYQIKDQLCYALEGSVFVAGAAVQWLRDGLKIISHSNEIEALAQSVPDSGGVCMVPALTGLGAPHWDPHARGAILGITRSTTAAHIARATLEGIALQVCDVFQAMCADTGLSLTELRVDGGASANDFLMQLQSDLLNVELVRPKCVETTALGAAFLAGLAVGFWKNSSDLEKHWQEEKRFAPKLSRDQAQIMLNRWNQAVTRAKNWAS